MRARDIMTPDPVTVPPDMPLEAVAALMAERHVSGLPPKSPPCEPVTI